MKKLICGAMMLVGTMAFSQVTFGVRANMLFNTSSAKWSDITSTASSAWENSGKNNSGYKFGLSAKFNLPITSLFLMPEIYYTSIKNTIEISDAGRNVELEAKNNRVDVPILIGTNLLGETISGFVGPVFSYNLAKENTFQDFKENATKDFSAGYQIGANAKFQNFVINARYEGAFSSDTRTFINKVSNKEYSYDNRSSFFIVGLGYNF